MDKSTKVVLILSLCLFFSFMVSTEGRGVRTATKPQQAYEPQTFPGFNGIFGNPQPGSGGLGPVFGLGRSIPGLPGSLPGTVPGIPGIPGGGGRAGAP